MRMAGMTVMVIVLVSVSVMLVMVVLTRVQCEGGAQASGEQADAHNQHERTRYEAQDGEEALRHDVLRGKQRHQSKREHPERMGNGHRQAEESSMTCGAMRTHEIRANHRLAV